MFTEGLDVFLADFGVPCVANGHTFTGLLDMPDETMNMAGVNVMSTMYVCTIKTSDGLTASLASGTAITVNAAAYVIRDVVLLEDGSFTQLAMSR